MKKHSLLLCITLFIIILSIIITFFVILTNKGNHNSDISKDKENVETQIKEDNNQNVDEKVDCQQFIRQIKCEQIYIA